MLCGVNEAALGRQSSTSKPKAVCREEHMIRCSVRQNRTTDRALELEKTGRYRDALLELDSGIRLYPDRVYFHYLRALIHRALGTTCSSIRDAIDCYTSSLGDLRSLTSMDPEVFPRENEGREWPARKWAVSAYIALLSHPVDKTRHAALRSLRELGPEAKEAIPAIEKAARSDGNWYPSYNYALQRIRSSADESEATSANLLLLLRERIERFDSQTRGGTNTTNYAGSLAEELNLPTPVLHAKLADPDEGARARAAAILGSRVSAEPEQSALIHSLLSLMNDRRAVVRGLTIFALGFPLSTAASSYYRFTDSTGFASSDEIEVYHQIVRPLAVNKITVALRKDRSYQVRRIAAEVLGAFGMMSLGDGRTSLCSELTEGLTDENRAVQHETALALSKFGPFAAHAVPLIKPLLASCTHGDDSTAILSVLLALGGNDEGDRQSYLSMFIRKLRYGGRFERQIAIEKIKTIGCAEDFAARSLIESWYMDDYAGNCRLARLQALPLLVSMGGERSPKRPTKDAIGPSAAMNFSEYFNLPPQSSEANSFKEGFLL
jgi:HEAT repeat protein